MDEALSQIKQRRQQRAAARYFKCSRTLFKLNKQKAGRKPVSMEAIRCVKDFYEANSNPLPDKKLVGKKTHKPRHVMDCIIAELYEKYTKTHPEQPVSATFYLHRLVHVKDKSSAKYVGCLCEYCENITLKIHAVKKLKPGTFRNEYHLAACTLCDKPTGEGMFVLSAQKKMQRVWTW